MEAVLNHHKSMWQLFLEQFMKHKPALIGFITICVFVLIGLSADGIALLLNLDPDTTNILERYAPISLGHLLGTDEAGRDVFIRLVYGTQISLLIAFLAAISSAVIGVIAGSLAGYFGGWVDVVIMRIVDSLLALPLIPVLIIMAAIDFEKIPFLSFLGNSEHASVFKMILILMAFSWMTQARLIRGAILEVKNAEFVMAAKTIGLSHFEIVFKEILPNVVSPLIVSVTLNVGYSILFEAALSFLGLGIQPPTPSWGSMLNNAQEIIYEAPHLAFIPGFLILLVVVSFNFFGDGLQDALDPKALRR
jgi:peptide/nickel transport system permease protein